MCLDVFNQRVPNQGDICHTCFSYNINKSCFIHFLVCFAYISFTCSSCVMFDFINESTVVALDFGQVETAETAETAAETAETADGFFCPRFPRFRLYSKTRKPRKIMKYIKYCGFCRLRQKKRQNSIGC